MDNEKLQESTDRTGSFISTILLDECSIDLDLLRNQLKEDWDIVIDKKSDEDGESIIEKINDMTIVVSLTK